MSLSGLGAGIFRTFEFCSENPFHGCDSFGRYIYYGGLVVFQLTKGAHNVASGRILAVSGMRLSRRVRVIFDSRTDTIRISGVSGNVPLIYCGLRSAERGYCGA